MTSDVKPLHSMYANITHVLTESQMRITLVLLCKGRQSIPTIHLLVI